MIEEGNATCDHKNFDIEVFEMLDTTGSLGEKTITPLSFLRPIKMVENNILLEPAEARRRSGRSSGPITKDSSYVEYYFNIDVDNEVDRSTVCEAITKFKKRGKNIYSPCGIDFDCPDLEDAISMDIYDSDAEDDRC